MPAIADNQRFVIRRAYEGIQALGDAIEHTGINADQRRLILDMVRQVYRLATLLAECKRLEDIRLFEDWDEDEKVRP